MQKGKNFSLVLSAVDAASSLTFFFIIIIWASHSVQNLISG